MQLFQSISYLDLGEGEMVRALAGCCGGCRAVDRGRDSQVECMASRREMLIEILNYSEFIVVTVFPSLRAVGSWEEVLLFSMDFTVYTTPLRLVCSSRLALTTYSSPDPLAPGHLQVHAR